MSTGSVQVRLDLTAIWDSVACFGSAEQAEYCAVMEVAGGCGALWTIYRGTPLSYSGGQIVFRRLRRRSGITIAHAHRFRHTWAQTALRKGAERALVQDAMGWSSDAMVRRYGGWVRSQTAAEAMPRFAPI